MNPTRIPALVPSLALLIAAAAGQASDVRFQTVALSGDPAPGLAGLTFDWFSDPRITTTIQGGPDPRIAFWADVAGAGVTEANNGTIWSNRTGVLALVAREGDPSPIPNLVWGAIPSPAAAFANPAGQSLGFTASLFDPAQPSLPTNLGMFAETSPGGGFSVVAREGEQAPGLPAGTNFSNLPVAPFSGAFDFSANKGRAIWRGVPGSVNPIVGSGLPAPGLSGTYFGHLSNPIARDSTGRLAISATLFPNPLQTGQPTGAGIWLGNPAGPPFTLVANVGGIATQIGPQVKYKDLSAQPLALSFGGTTRTAFWASLMDGGVTPNNDAAIFVTTSQSPFPRLREGNAAPGVGPGVFFSGFSRQFAAVANFTGPNSYYVAARASIIGDGVSNLNNSGIWLTLVESIALVAREGDQVPRLPAGTFFASFADPAVNLEGQVVFLARLRGPAVTQETSVVLMGTEPPINGIIGPAGRLAPLARSGDMFLVGPGDARKVNEIIFDSGPTGSGAEALARHGMLAFKLGFKDPIVPTPPPPQLAFTFTQGLFTGTIRCLADINADGALNVADFGAFQNAYVLGDLRVCDFTEEGLLTVADFGAFQTAFVSGCP